MLLIYPIFVIYVIETRRPILEHKESRERFGALYEDIHMSRN
jgi:hypothetical protein